MTIRDWLSKLFFPSTASGNIPEGWTTDLNIALPPTLSYDEIVDFVISAARSQTDDATTERRLVETLGLSADSAALARDRVFGGIVRAATKNSVNRPNRKDDPLAFLSFHRATEDPSIIADIYPQFSAESE